MKRGYGSFAALCLGLAVAALAVGFWPTRHLGGPEALAGMLVGIGIALAASLTGGIVVARPAAGAGAINAALLAMLVRLLVAVALSLAAALSGALPRVPLLLWVAIGYLAMLPADVKLALAQTER